MKYLNALRDEVRCPIELVEPADIVAGITCNNNQAKIGHVVKQVSIGLHKYYPDNRSLIVVSDCDPVDDFREKARAVQIPLFQEIIVTIYRGVPGKGAAEEEIETQAMLFEDEEPYLLERWKIADEAIAFGSTCRQPS